MNFRLPRSLFWSLIIVFTCPIAICADIEMEGTFENLAPQYEKIYVSPEQIVITPEAIFFLSPEGLLIQTRLVSVDAAGIFVVAAKYQCPACRRGNNNNVCWNQNCPLYGR